MKNIPFSVYDFLAYLSAGIVLIATVDVIYGAIWLLQSKVPLPFDALVSFAFNLGAGALQRSTLRRKVNREEHAAVPAEFRRWIWAGGRRLNGLVWRREAEAVLYAGSRHGTRPAIG